MIGNLVDVDVLDGDARELVRRIDPVLDGRALPGLDRHAVEVEVDGGNLTIVLPHVDGDRRLGIRMGGGEGIIDLGPDHLHIGPGDEGWPDGAASYVDAMAELVERALTGGLELEVRFRWYGVSTTTWLVEPDGSRTPFM